MNAHKLISLTAAVLITAGSIGALAALSSTALVPSPATIGGLPVTDLPGIIVHPDTTTTARPHGVKTPRMATRVSTRGKVGGTAS